MYQNDERNTKYKTLQLPKLSRNISDKDSYVVAIKMFNKQLTNELKVLDLTISKKTIKKKLKDFVINL